jgi:hypothetical protein
LQQEGTLQVGFPHCKYDFVPIDWLSLWLLVSLFPFHYVICTVHQH